MGSTFSRSQDHTIMSNDLSDKVMKARVKDNGKVVEVQPRSVYSPKGEIEMVDYVCVNDEDISYNEDELEFINGTIDVNEKDLLSNIFDVLAHNTMYIEPERIVTDYDVQVDFDEKTIELYDKETQSLVVKLQAIFPSK